MSRKPVEPEPTDIAAEPDTAALVHGLSRFALELESLQVGVDEVGEALQDLVLEAVRRRLAEESDASDALDDASRRSLEPLAALLAARAARVAQLDFDTARGRIGIRSTRPEKWRRRLHGEIERLPLGMRQRQQIRETMERAMKSLHGAWLEIDAATRTRLEELAARVCEVQAAETRRVPPHPPVPGPPTPPIPDPGRPPKPPEHPGPTQPPEPPVPPAPPTPPLH
jgi:hypothetical protein